MFTPLIARAVGRTLMGAAAAGLVLLLPSCSLIVERSADQCSTNADCSAFPGTTCQAGICTGGGAGECLTNQQCVDAHGKYFVCRKSDHSCVSLLSKECTTVEGDYLDDDAFMFGSVLPTVGDDSATGKTLEDSIKLAISDFASASNGLPPVSAGKKPRPLVLVGCSDDSSSDTAVVAARHLAEDVQVPAIIGSAYSGITIKMATTVTIPDGVLVISPSATSIAITDLQDNGLLWRTSPSDVLQAQALALFMPTLEQQVRDELGLTASDKINVAILHKGDSYGKQLATALEKQISFNGASALDPANSSHYVRFDYGNPDDPNADPLKYDKAIAQVMTLKPHILLIFGTDEGVEKVMEPIETSWDQQAQATYKPHYVFSDGELVPTLWQFVGKNDALRKRIFGSVPGTTNLLFQSYSAAYNSRFTDGTSPDVFGGAGAYDATYLLAYSAVSLGSTPITGASLAEGLKKMVPPGTKVDVGAENINTTFPVLQAGNSIDFNGASGPLDFDVKTGEARSDIQIWCLPKDGSGAAVSAKSSGAFLNAQTSKLEGQVGSICD